MRGRGKPSGKDKPRGCMTFFVTIGRSVNQRLATSRNALRRKFKRNNNDVRPLTPEELENETGARDLVFVLKPVGPVKAERFREASSPKSSLEESCAIDSFACSRTEEEQTARTSPEDNTPTVTKIAIEDTAPQTDDHTEQVRNYVNSIIQNALRLAKIEAEGSVKDHGDEPDSNTSSFISDMVDMVMESSYSRFPIIEKDDDNIRDTVARDPSGTSIASSDISQIAELAVSDSLSKIAAILEGNNNANARRPRCEGEMK